MIDFILSFIGKKEDTRVVNKLNERLSKVLKYKKCPYEVSSYFEESYAESTSFIIRFDDINLKCIRIKINRDDGDHFAHVVIIEDKITLTNEKLDNNEISSRRIFNNARRIYNMLNIADKPISVKMSINDSADLL